MWILFFMGIGVLVMVVLGISVLFVMGDSDKDGAQKKVKSGQAA
jgi:hypothetical protein